MRDFTETVLSLQRARQAFATATVVGRRAPVSAHLGDRAIVHADGRMEGFIGGACSREIVRKQALDAIKTGRPRLVSITPDVKAVSSADPEHVIVSMTCASEGAVDVYVEPNQQPRRLVVVGATPVASSLARTAHAADYDVVRVVDSAEVSDVSGPSGSAVAVVSLDGLAQAITDGGPGTAVVVASQGHYDEEALESALTAGASYVGLVASRTRGATVKKWLSDRNAPGVDRLRNPAGLDLGARTAPDVALSILAEIVQSLPAHAVDARDHATPEAKSATVPSPIDVAIDPVCHMEVTIATARHSADVLGTTYYFCCAGCRTQFQLDPTRFLAHRA
jgi:xanthine dehydrogenase accessory factor